MRSPPIHHHRRGKMLVLTVPRISVWFRSPQVSLGHCDVLLSGLLLDEHPSLFFRPPSRPTSTVTFFGEHFLTQVAKGVTFPPELYGHLSPWVDLIVSMATSHCRPWAPWGQGPYLTPLWILRVTARYRAGSTKHLLISSFSISYNLKYNFNDTNFLKHDSILIKQRGLYSPLNPEMLPKGNRKTGSSSELQLLQEWTIFGSQLISQCWKLMHLRFSHLHPLFPIKTF